MAAHVPAGERSRDLWPERLSAALSRQARVSRVGNRPLNTRNPLPRVTELREPYDAVAVRNPRFIVVNDWWLRHYTEPQSELGGRRMPSKAQAALV